MAHAERGRDCHSTPKAGLVHARHGNLPAPRHRWAFRLPLYHVGSMRALAGDLIPLSLAVAALALLTGVYRWFGIGNATTVALTFLLVVLVVAATARLRTAVVVSVLAMLAFNYFFLPPVGTWTIADPQNWVALFVFLAVSLVASRLADAARSREGEAVSRRVELARLFDLSRDVLVMTATPDAASHLAHSIARRFDLDHVSIALPGSERWSIASGGTKPMRLDEAELVSAFHSVGQTLEFDARARTYTGHHTVTVNDELVRLVPLRVGTKPIGLLAASGRAVEPGTLDALAGVVAIGVERMRLLEDRKEAELTRQSEALKTALLASLGHDLRTPLTTIRVAADNLKAGWLSPEERTEQGDLVLAEVERLSRLFENVLEMARIDSGAVERAARWSHVSEVVAAAREQVAHALASHPVTVSVADDQAIRVDSRIAAGALAYLLENAAQYTAAGTPIEIGATLVDNECRLRVRDHGPGIPVADLPRLFERFYRGAGADVRASGSGLGLWIARSLLAAAGGQVWAENVPDGGAAFTLSVPVLERKSAPAEVSS